ncbi:MAG: glycyl-tRNA synthetase beta chain [Pseudomonadota bacterium]|nr:glycyl-tRNA synthetase beta chain [Pseudomonadota bacterium]
MQSTQFETQTLVSSSLLCEFLTEELPPIGLEKNIGETFAQNLSNELKGFIANPIHPEFFVTPRRFGCIFQQVSMQEPEQKVFRRGPLIASSLDNNSPTPSLLGFIKSCGISNWQDLEQRNDGYFYAQKTIPGRKLTDVLPQAIQTALKKLPIAKNMRWGSHEYHFVRPVHNLVIMFGKQVICQDSQILGLTPVNYTFGHRIMSAGKIIITEPVSYVEQMKNQGMVLVNFAQRRDYIWQNLQQQAHSLGLMISDIPGLLDEVTALVEYPVVLCGEFDSAFLKIPQECLILSMAKNQKYFALLDNRGCLSNKFLFVANIDSLKPEVIVRGNQKVLNSRLSDAKFFYETDLKHDLSAFVEKLDSVIYHNLLGTQLQRVARLQNIASQIAPAFNILPNIARGTAFLLKADLTTEMVGEFPQLQGVMGRYYALAKGDGVDVSSAIEQHYYPRFSGDKLPDTPLATLMAVTDKLETLIGIWGIGLIPTGEKDQFGLRRAALGIVRILLNTKLNSKNLNDLLESAYSSFEGLNLTSNTAAEVYQFILQRLANYLVSVENYAQNCVQSVLFNQPDSFDHLRSLLDVLQTFAKNPQNQNLLQANKRIRNIMEKNNIPLVVGNAAVDKEALFIQNDLLITDEEKNLFELLAINQLSIKQCVLQHNWLDFFNLLAKFNQPIAAFFDKVMVMDENMDIRKNRIALLLNLYAVLNQACELSELV